MGLLDEVLVSTDSLEYLDMVRHYDIRQDYLRPKELSGDKSPTVDGILHAICWFQSVCNKTFDAVMVLQPTSPFRSLNNIEGAIIKMKQTPLATCVTSVSILADHHPKRIKTMDSSGLLHDICTHFHEPDPSRRQDFTPKAYIRNGAIYLTRVTTVLSDKKIRGDRVYGFQTHEANSINVDEHLDFLTASAILKYPEYSEYLSCFRPLLEKYKK